MATLPTVNAKPMGESDLPNQDEASPTTDRAEPCAEGVGPAAQALGSPAKSDTADGAEPDSVDAVIQGLESVGYLTGQGLATSVFLALRLRRPLFLEGEPGVGKTEVAKALSRWLRRRLIRLQCYEGLDLSQAVYEWDHARQLLHLRVAEATGQARLGRESELEAGLYDERFLVRRPILEALSTPEGEPPPVLLVDEIDRADDEFEAFLLEALSDYAVTVPQLGTIHAAVPPIVILTSNRTRDVHDALKRRCLYHWVEHPNLSQEVTIISRRVPGIDAVLSTQIAAVAAELRSLGLYKPPGVAETIDWASAVVSLGQRELSPEVVESTLGTMLKYREDQQRVRHQGVHELISAALARH